jgi:hypothetical protein
MRARSTIRSAMALATLVGGVAHTFAPVSAGAQQRVVLELRPRFGDTLKMVLHQTTEVSGTRKGVSAKPMVTELSMFSRAIVELSTPASALILAITDSVDARSTDSRAAQLVSETERQLEGRSLRVRMSPDGTVGLAERPPDVPSEVNDFIALMPASFPKGSVAIGDTWLREMQIPPSANFGVPVTGLVRAAFRLDSIAKGGDEAYVSMKGTLLPNQDGSAPGAYTGTVNGAMIVDRRRGWLTESSFLVQMRSSVIATNAGRTDTIHMRLKLTQHMVTERR